MSINLKSKLGIFIKSMIIVFMLIVVGVMPTKLVSAKVIKNDKTGIPDKALYQAILFETGKNSNQKITEKDLENVYSIGDYFIEKNENRKIKSLKGIEKCKKLFSLEIPICGLKNLKGIEKCKNLEFLTIRNGNLEAVNNLAQLSKLQKITMKNVKVKDWNGLGMLRQITNLEIYKGNLKNLKQIKKLGKIEYITIKKTKITNVKGIEKLKNLKGMYFADNKLKKLSGIQNFKKLEDVDVSNNKLTQLPSMKKLKKFNLEFSSFAGNKLSKKELKKKLPSNVPNWWIDDEAILQKTKKKLEIKNKNKITASTKSITGMTEKNTKVKLMTLKGEKIKEVKANQKGKFKLNGLDLKQYQGKQLKIVVCKRLHDYINGEGGDYILKTIKFKVKKQIFYYK